MLYIHSKGFINFRLTFKCVEIVKLERDIWCLQNQSAEVIPEQSLPMMEKSGREEERRRGEGRR